MMSAKKFLLSVFVVALLVASIEGQHYGSGGHGGQHYGRGGYGGQRYRQGNRGGDANLAQSQDAYNVNYGEGDLNNNQRSQTAQGVSQENYNGPYGRYHY